MEQEQKGISGIPISGALVIVALILGLITIPQLPYTPSRPKNVEPIKIAQPEVKVRARLWQDPFAAVMRDEDYSKTKPKNNKISNLIDQIDHEDKGHTVVLGVMVFGGPYAEDAESRTRYRYAVLSALGELGYVPKDSEHIGYLKNVSFNNKNNESWNLELLPYEWFESDFPSPGKILVLWLNDASFYGSPLKRLSNLADALNPKTRNNEPALKLKILGPAGSTNLRSIVEEVNLEEKQKKALRNVEIFSWSATVDPEKLLPEKVRQNNCSRISLAEYIENNCMIGKDKTLSFYRTIGSDKELTDLLVNELDLRGLLPKTNSDISNTKNTYGHIALISEWDTFYGRNLPETFIKSVVDKCGLAKEKIDWIYKISYMQGIDGQIPEDTSVAAKTSNSSDKKETDKKEEDIEKAEGRSQYDYLRRLALRLKKLDEKIIKNNKGKGIKAIGVLGSDVYDKLLVLQAIYKLFPNVIFFTTDLDARLLHPHELKWTRNLVIASNFGLRLNENLQKKIPPFRDNYQTSLFLSTQIALSTCMNKHNEADKWFDTPRVFEVGRSGAFPLEFKNSASQEIGNICQIFDNSEGSIHPTHPGYGGVWMHSAFRWLFFVAALLFVICFVIYYSRLWNKEVAKGVEGSLAYVLSPCFLILFLIILVFLLTFIITSQFQGGEPFTFFEGISIWPSEFLRLLAAGLSLYFLITGILKTRWTDKKLSNQFFNPSPDPSSKEKVDTLKKCITERVKPPASVWDVYKNYTTWKRRCLRVFSLSLLYFGICASIIFMFGKPFVPYRGSVSKIIDICGITVFAVPFFILLLIWVIDSTNISRWLIRRLSEVWVDWPEEATRDISIKFKADPSCIKEWIDFQVIVKISENVGRFVYYPFIVILILGASRLRYFDKWDLPIGLLIVIMLGLSYSVYCAISLRKTAQETKERILHKLWERQMNAKGDGNASLAEQIKMMSDAIKSTRKGAFVPFFEQPWARAVALFLGGSGSLLALNLLPF